MGTLLDKPITEKETLSIEHEGIRFAASAMQGWRVEMEDQHSITASIPELRDHAFVAVFDGHGGSFAAEFAAREILGILCKTEEFKEYSKGRGEGRDPARLEAALRRAFLDVDAALLRAPEVAQQGDRSGCTALAAVVGPRHLVVASAGDSRAVLATGANGALALSEDHKPDNPEEQRRVERAGGCVSMRRVDGDLAVSRALGDFQYKDRPDLPPEAQKVSAEPDCRTHTRLRADQVLILACDGIWDVMSNADAADLARALGQEGEKDLGLICEELLDQCLAKGSRDNMSVVAVAFSGFHTASEGGGVIARRTARAEEEAMQAAAEQTEGAEGA